MSNEVRRIKKIAARLAALSEQDYSRLSADEKASWNDIAAGFIKDVDASSPHKKRVNQLIENLDHWEKQDHSTVTIRHLRSHFGSTSSGTN